jgi:UDP-glucose 4-epimerase
LRSGEADADAAMGVNVAGLARLLDAAREQGIGRVVWTSSTVVYGPAADYVAQPVDEGAPIAPITWYGLTKAMAEQVSAYHRRRHRLRATALRLPLVLGPGLWYEGAAAALASLFRDPAPAEITFHDEPIDLVHVADVSRAILLLLEADAPAPVYNLEGFRARASDLLRRLEARRPGLSIRHNIVPPPLELPLISGRLLAADTGFAPDYDLDRFVDSMLESGG